MAECPRCGERIGALAVGCECGWRSRVRRESKAEEPLPHVQCAFQTCASSAKSKVLTPTGWAKFCDAHYSRYFEDRAHEGLAAKGLERLADETRSEHTQRLRAWFKAHAKFKTFADADEKAA